MEYSVSALKRLNRLGEVRRRKDATKNLGLDLPLALQSFGRGGTYGGDGG
jgi:hypothetical protein